VQGTDSVLGGRVWGGVRHTDETGHAGHVDDDTSFAGISLLVLFQHHFDLLLHAQEGAFLIDIIHEVHIIERSDMEWHESTRHAGVIDSCVEAAMCVEDMLV
jgi:hypothetical protein